VKESGILVREGFAVTAPTPRIEAVLDGPAVQDRVSVDVLVSLARELQSSLRRILGNRKHAKGRFVSAIEEACRLEFVGFRAGSAVCTFEFARAREGDARLDDQGVRAAEELLQAFEAGERGAEGWSRRAPPGLLDGLDKIAKIVGNGIDGVEFRLHAGPIERRVRITSAFRTNVRAALTPVDRPDELRIEGVIWECDWRRHTAELQTPDGKRVTLNFPAILDEIVTGARRQRVVVHGQSSDRRELVRVLDVSRLEPAEDGLCVVDPAYGAFSDNLSIEDLAARQGVTVPTSLDELRSDWLDGEPLDELLGTIRWLRQ
jgi:hypothetical protein